MKPAHRGFTLVELLVVIGIVAILVGLMLPAIQQARESANRLKCQNHLKQIGLALHEFHDAYRVFPPSGWTKSGPGNPRGRHVGWRPLILPFLEQKNLHDLYDFQWHWWEGTNAVTAAVPVTIFRCPSVPRRPEVNSAPAKPPRPALSFSNPIAPTDYEAIIGVQPAAINPHLPTARYTATNRFSVMSRNSQARLADVLDGTSMTVMVVECGARPTVYRRRAGQRGLTNDQGIGWADSEGPFSLDGATPDGFQEGCGPQAGCSRAMNARNDNEPYSLHLGGINGLFADGHVAFLSETQPIAIFAALCTMAADEVNPVSD